MAFRIFLNSFDPQKEVPQERRGHQGSKRREVGGKEGRKEGRKTGREEGRKERKKEERKQERKGAKGER